jgi:hypothetical protein
MKGERRRVGARGKTGREKKEKRLSRGFSIFALPVTPRAPFPLACLARDYPACKLRTKTKTKHKASAEESVTGISDYMSNIIEP